jgi:hypothetical protein
LALGVVGVESSDFTSIYDSVGIRAMLELNGYFLRIKDMQGRLEALRGYL